MASCRSSLLAGLAFSISLAACGGTEPSAVAESPTASAVGAADVTGVRVVAPEQAAQTISDAPDDLVILDVRTQEEFDEGHIEGAVLLDFYRDDFAEELAELDTEVPYVLYCRSGNRSGQARTVMADLGFRSVEDVDGGIVAWQAADLPVTPAE